MSKAELIFLAKLSVLVNTSGIAVSLLGRQGSQFLGVLHIWRPSLQVEESSLESVAILFLGIYP